MSPTANKIESIWGNSAKDVWIIGDAGTILRRQQ
jgi:hypothetical protein